MASISFALGAGVRPVLSGTDPTLDTTTQQTFTVSQTAATSGTGTITWSYSLPQGVAVQSSSDTQIVFVVPVGTLIVRKKVIVTATNQVGIASAPLTLTVSAGRRPVLVSPGTQTLDTSTAPKSFTVGQSALNTGVLSWNYTDLTTVDEVSTDIYAQFTVRAGTNISTQTFSVTATSETGLVSTPVTFSVTAYIGPALSASDASLDLTTDQFVTFRQTVPTGATGTITWGYPVGSNVFSSSDSALVLAFPAASAVRTPSSLTVTATNPLGVVASKTVSVAASLRPVNTTASSNIVLDTTTTQTFTVSQTGSTTSTGTISWTYENLPTNITVTVQNNTTLTFQVASTTVIPVAQPFIVQATSQTGLKSTSITFNIQAAVKPVLVSPGNQTLDTTTEQIFAVTQTAQNYGTITWSITPSFPNGVRTLQQDSGLTVIVPQGTSTLATSYTITATNIVGTASTPVVITLAAAARPVLVGPSITTFDTTTDQTFVVAQTVSQPITWAYTTLPTGVSLLSTTNTALTFTVAQASYFTANNVVFTATNQAGISTSLGITIAGFIPSAFTMNFGASTIPAFTDGGVYQTNLPPPTMSYPPVSLYLEGSTNTYATYEVTGQPYGNGPYSMTASTVGQNMTNVFSLSEGVYWSSAATYSAGVYTGGQSTTVGSTVVTGEWIQLQIPDTIVCTSIQLIEVGGANATSFMIAGTNDGTVWTSVYADATATSQSSGFFRTVLNITGAQAFRTYRYIARAINTSASAFSLGGFQVIGTYSYAAPLLVNPRKISLLTAAPQTFTIAQVADSSATGPLTWNTSPYLSDTSTNAVSVSSPSVLASTPFSNVADGSFSGLITITGASKLEFDPTLEDFTLELWVYGTGTTIGGIISRAPAVVHGGLIDWQLYQSSTEVYFQFNSFRVGRKGTPIPLRAWTHVAFVITRANGTATLYINGTRIATATNVSGGSYVSGRNLYVGAGNTGTAFNGYISNLRIVRGYAAYTTEFTPSIVPLTQTSLGTTVLLLQVRPTLPAGITITNVTPAGITFTAAANTVVSQDFTVQVQNLTGTSSSATFSIIAT